MIPQKIFSVEEADQLLGVIIPILEQLQGLQQSILKTDQEIEDASDKVAAGNGYPIDELKQRIEDLTEHQMNLAEAFQSALEQLEGLGCVLKDLTPGLVDFYGMRDGELVFLCWKLGEERVQFWHGVDQGYANRQPLP